MRVEVAFPASWNGYGSPDPPEGQVVRQISDERQMVAKVPLVEKRLVEVALVVVELMRFGRYWRVPRVVVALIRASALASVKYRFDPSATAVVKRPRVEVESCCHEPPAYEPRRMPAAVGFVIPVPPPPAVSTPARVFVKVRMLPEPTTVVEAVSPLNGVEEVAIVMVAPV